MFPSVAPEVIAAAIVIAAAAGVVRGITGFGGAMVMSPPLALLLGPWIAVPVVLLLEGLIGAQMLVQTRRLIRWRVIGPILAMGCLTIPLGAQVLVSVDAVTLRRMIAATVIVFAALLLFGWRYQGPHRLGTALGLGALSGAMLGATSIGGPPVILYLLSGPDPVETTRANLSLFVAGISSAGLAMLWANGVLGAAALWVGLLLAPGFYGGMVLGIRLFPRFDDTRFRRFTLLVLVVVSFGILLA